MNVLVLSTLCLTLAQSPPNDAVVPVPQQGQWWMNRHQAMNARAAQGGVDLVFIGDSITHAFGGDPYTGENFANRGKDTWDLFYGDRRATNLGISGDRTQHVLWRLEHGNLDGIRPRAAVVMIGTNNVGANDAGQIAEGVEAVCQAVRRKSPRTRVLLLGIFPRGLAGSPERAKIAETNSLLDAWAKTHRIDYLDIGDVFLDAHGEIPDEVMPDKLHPTALGYRKWAMAMEPRLARLLGERPKTTADPRNSAVVPVTQQRDDYNWLDRHRAVLELVRKRTPRLAFIGDSITHAWAGPPASPNRMAGAKVWERMYSGRNAINLGFGWDRTENVIWRIEQGELAGADLRAAVVMIGTNNLGLNTPEQIRDGIGEVVARIHRKAPRAKVLLLGIFPRGQKPDDPYRRMAAEVNRLLPALARRVGATYMDIGARFLEPDGTISREMMPDFLHLTEKGYAIWADAIEPVLRQWLDADEARAISYELRA